MLRADTSNTPSLFSPSYALLWSPYPIVRCSRKLRLLTSLIKLVCIFLYIQVLFLYLKMKVLNTQKHGKKVKIPIPPKPIITKLGRGNDKIGNFIYSLILLIPVVIILIVFIDTILKLI